MIMKMPISNYQWHEFFPNGNISNFVLLFSLKFFATVACAYYKFTFGTDVVTHNMGVVIAIWAPIVLVSEPLKNSMIENCHNLQFLYTVMSVTTF